MGSDATQVTDTARGQPGPSDQAALRRRRLQQHVGKVGRGAHQPQRQRGTRVDAGRGRHGGHGPAPARRAPLNS